MTRRTLRWLLLGDALALVVAYLHDVAAAKRLIVDYLRRLDNVLRWDGWKRVEFDRAVNDAWPREDLAEYRERTRLSRDEAFWRWGEEEATDWSGHISTRRNGPYTVTFDLLKLCQDDLEAILRKLGLMPPAERKEPQPPLSSVPELTPEQIRRLPRDTYLNYVLATFTPDPGESVRSFLNRCRKELAPTDLKLNSLTTRMSERRREERKAGS